MSDHLDDIPMINPKNLKGHEHSVERTSGTKRNTNLSATNMNSIEETKKIEGRPIKTSYLKRRTDHLPFAKRNTMANNKRSILLHSGSEPVLDPNHDPISSKLASTAKFSSLTPSQMSSDFQNILAQNKV